MLYNVSYHIFIDCWLTILLKHFLLLTLHTPRSAAELGDYDASKHLYGYVSEFRFNPSQTKELEYRISEIHKQLKGVGPAQAEFNYLDKVKWLDLYGVDLHPVLVSERDNNKC